MQRKTQNTIDINRKHVTNCQFRLRATIRLLHTRDTSRADDWAGGRRANSALRRHLMELAETLLQTVQSDG
jgi:hypothetical protein